MLLLTVAVPVLADVPLSLYNGGSGTAYYIMVTWRATSTPVGTSTYGGMVGTSYALGPGQTANVGGAGWNASDAIYLWVRWYMTQADFQASQNIQTVGPFQKTAGQTEINLSYEPGGAAPDQWSFKFCINNPGSGSRLYYAYKQGVRLSGSGLFVPAGETKCKTVTMVEGYTTNDVQIVQFTHQGDPVQNEDGSWSYGSEPEPDFDTPPIPVEWCNHCDPGAPSAFDAGGNDTPAVGPATNAPITFNTDEIVVTLKEGFNVLYDEMATFHRDNNAATRPIAGMIGIANTKLDTLSTKLTTLDGSVDAVTTAVVGTTSAVNTLRDGLTNNVARTSNNTSNALLRLAQIEATSSNLNAKATGIWQFTSNSAAMGFNIKDNTYGALSLLSGISGYNQTMVSDLATAKTYLGEIRPDVDDMRQSLTLSTNLLTGMLAQGNAGTNLLSETAYNLRSGTNLLGSINGILEGMGTNETGIKAAIGVFHQDNTNWLGQIYGALQGTNDGSWTNLPPEHSSASLAKTAADTAMSGPSATLEGMAATVGGAGIGAGIGEGEEFLVEIPFGPGLPTMSIAPMSGLFGNIFETARRVWVLILVAGYGLKVLMDLQRASRIVFGSRGVMIPNMEFLGINAAGAALVPVIVIAGLALWAACLAALFGTLVGEISWSSLFSNSAIGTAFDLVDGKAKWLLLRTFPLALALALLTAYLTFRLTSFKVMLAFQAAAKFLVGW